MILRDMTPVQNDYDLAFYHSIRAMFILKDIDNAHPKRVEFQEINKKSLRRMKYLEFHTDGYVLNDGDKIRYIFNKAKISAQDNLNGLNG